ncbi:hypothetical protein D3C71_2208910 [compost metagenome]
MRCTSSDLSSMCWVSREIRRAQIRFCGLIATMPNGLPLLISRMAWSPAPNSDSGVAATSTSLL